MVAAPVAVSGNPQISKRRPVRLWRRA